MKEEIKNLPELLNFVNGDPSSNKKYFCHLGPSGRQAAHLIAEILGAIKVDFELIIDSDGVRHTLAQHGVAKSKLEAERNQIPIVEANILALPSWLLGATTIKAGQFKPGKQPRIEIESADSAGTTIVIMEWRPGRQQLALVTMYKKGQLLEQLTFDFSSSERCAALRNASPS